MTLLRHLLLYTVLASTLAACQGAGPSWATQVPIAGPETPPMAAFLQVRDANGVAGPFRLDDVERLSVEVQLVSALPGAHDFRLDVLTPAGTLYAQLPVTAEADAAGQANVAQPIEVRGTPIDLLHLTGAWTFRLAQVDGDRALALAEAEVGE